MEETGDVEFESPHLHQRGLVTDQALSLAPRRPPSRRYTLVHTSLGVQPLQAVGQACQLGIQALQLLGAVEYETGVQRVRDLRTKLRPWRNHPAVADLTEQLLLVS